MAFRSFPALSNLTDVNLSSLVDFQALRYDALTSKWVNDFFPVATLLDRQNGYRIDEMFYHDAGAALLNSWNDSVSGAVNPGVSEASHPGIILTSTAASATGRAYMGWSGTNGSGKITFGNGIVRLGAVVRIPILSVLAERFMVQMGYFTDVNLANPLTDAIYFFYEDDVNGGKWELRTLNDALNPNVADSGVAVVAGSWYLLELEVNAAATLVEYYINRVLVGSFNANIPSGAGDPMAPVFGIRKTAGVTARTADWDYVYESQTFTTPR